ncbi:MAG TPA: hypothetical protein VGR89_08630 [Puia sp.]|nr:hypothetical protein [Puia sp.]
MKTWIVGLWESRRARWSSLGAVGVVAFLCVASMGQRNYRLGGAWVGSGSGETWTGVTTPLDPEGKTAVFTVHPIAWSEDSASLTRALGGDSVSDGVGWQKMVSQDTAQWGMVVHVLAGDPPQIVAFEVFAGTLRFMGPDYNKMQYTLTIFPASADKNGDGLPDPDAVPLMTIPNGTGTNTFVTGD